MFMSFDIKKLQIFLNLKTRVYKYNTLTWYAHTIQLCRV